MDQSLTMRPPRYSFELQSLMVQCICSYPDYIPFFKEIWPHETNIAKSSNPFANSIKVDEAIESEALDGSVDKIPMTYYYQ